MLLEKLQEQKKRISELLANEPVTMEMFQHLDLLWDETHDTLEKKQ